MNCEKINFLLDSKEAANLTAAEQQAVERHFASCRACREAWAAYREIAALEIPATPNDLRVRIATAVAGRAYVRRARRAVVIGGLFVAAAAAAVVSYRFVDWAPESTAKVTEESASAGAAPVSEERESQPVVSERLADGPRDEAARASAYALDRFSVAVFVDSKLAVEPDAAAAFAACHDEVLRELRGINGLNVIADTRVASFADSGLPPIEIARQLGAGSLLALRGMGPPSCSVTRVDVATGERAPGYMTFVSPDWQPDGWRRFAAAVATGTANALLKDPATLIVEAKATVLNNALEDSVRVSALYELQQSSAQQSSDVYAAYDEAVIAVAVQLGMTSRDAEVREAAWRALRGYQDESLVPSLLQVLVDDPDERVRRAAAFGLGYFLDEPGVADALARAAAEDPSNRPPLRCCLPNVRGAARLALLSGLEPRAAVLATLTNTELAPHERMSLLSPDGQSFLELDELGEEAARTVFEIGSQARDAATRARAWRLLQAVRVPDFTAALLDDLEDHPAEDVRAAAAEALAPYREGSDVRTALERAEADSSAAVQRAARSALR